MARIAKRGQVQLSDEAVAQSIYDPLGIVNGQPIVADRKGFTKKLKAGMPHAIEARKRGLKPTPYFFEALDYVRKARILQDASLENGGLGTPKVPKVGDPLMEAIPIYNTVRRRYAGFSNVLEQLWYGKQAPKYRANVERNFVAQKEPWKKLVKERLEEWIFICLAHRITGSGASFEWDHGWRNNQISDMSAHNLTVKDMAAWLADYDAPIFTSIGNQIPPFPPCGGREYLRTIAPKVVREVANMLSRLAWPGHPVPIKTAVDNVLDIHRSLGCKQFKFVLTAFVMDLAEYLPHLVDPTSDVYHGKNAMEAIEICFQVNMKKQELYDKATRLFADISGTWPMDVEDASPGCDLVRWIENYVPKRGFEHVIEKGIFNGSSLTWPNGRQPDPF